MPTVAGKAEPEIRTFLFLSVEHLRQANQHSFVRNASEFAHVAICPAAQILLVAHPRRRHWRPATAAPRRTHLRPEEEGVGLVVVLRHRAALFDCVPERISPLTRERIVVGHRKVARSDSADRLVPVDAIRRSDSKAATSLLDGQRLEPPFVECIVVHRHAYTVVALQSTGTCLRPLLAVFSADLHLIARGGFNLIPGDCLSRNCSYLALGCKFTRG